MNKDERLKAIIDVAAQLDDADIAMGRCGADVDQAYLCDYLVGRKRIAAEREGSVALYMWHCDLLAAVRAERARAIVVACERAAP